jgi:hypothetical protein
MLAPDVDTHVLDGLLHRTSAHLTHGSSLGLRHASPYPEHVGALRRPSCLAGCPPIMHPFVSTPRQNRARTSALDHPGLHKEGQHAPKRRTAGPVWLGKWTPRPALSSAVQRSP